MEQQPVRRVAERRFARGQVMVRPGEELDAMFFHIASGSGSNLAVELGCELDPDDADEGILKVTPDCETSVPGVYAAGDLTPGTRLVIRAASEGVRASEPVRAIRPTS